MLAGQAPCLAPQRKGVQFSRHSAEADGDLVACFVREQTATQSNRVEEVFMLLRNVLLAAVVVAPLAWMGQGVLRVRRFLRAIEGLRR